MSSKSEISRRRFFSLGLGDLARAGRTGAENGGFAVVDRSRCWSAQGQPCDYCQSECNRHLGAIAIELGASPIIDTTRCDGCGRCEQICPANGGTAIRVQPVDR